MCIRDRHNPAREIPNDKVAKKGPQVLTNKEIELLLAQPSPNDLKGIRDKAMLELLYATCIKVSELVSLDVDDVKRSLSFIKGGSGGKEQMCIRDRCCRPRSETARMPANRTRRGAESRSARRKAVD